MARARDSVAHFTIGVRGKQRLFLKALDTRKGETYIHIVSGDFHRPFGSARPPLPSISPIIQSEKISIHASKRSSEINDIHLTRLIADNTIRGSYSYDDGKCHHHTGVIKNGKNFAPFVFRVCPPLLGPTFDLRSSRGVIVEVDKYEPLFNTFVFAIIVSSRDTEFVLPEAGPFKVTQYPMNFVRLTILSSFLGAPSLSGSRRFISSLTPSEAVLGQVTATDLSRFANGLTAEETACYVWQMFNELRREYVRTFSAFFRISIPESAGRFYRDGLNFRYPFA